MSNTSVDLESLIKTPSTAEEWERAALMGREMIVGLRDQLRGQKLKLQKAEAQNRKDEFRIREMSLEIDRLKRRLVELQSLT